RSDETKGAARADRRPPPLPCGSPPLRSAWGRRVYPSAPRSADRPDLLQDRLQLGFAIRVIDWHVEVGLSDRLHLGIDALARRLDLQDAAAAEEPLQQPEQSLARRHQ